MKALLKIGVAFVTFVISGVTFADAYQIYVKRIDRDLYKTQEGVYIETQYCYHYSYGEDAILKYDQYSYDNKIIFDNDESCDVKRIFK